MPHDGAVPGSDPQLWRSKFLKELRLSLPPIRADARKLTQDEFADALVALDIDLGVTAEAQNPKEARRIKYNRLETGKDQPPDALLAAVAKAYGVDPPEPPKQELSDQAALIAALTRQAAALEERNRLDRDLIAALSGRVDELVRATADELLGLAERVAALEHHAPGGHPAGPSSGSTGGSRLSAKGRP